jgi:ABC-type sugar transport system ATPase subunit
MASVELQGISKRFGAVEVIRNLDLHVADGSFCALLGPSGCGKSTLLRMIAGLETVSEGNVQIGGIDVTHTPPAQRRVAMVFQSYALYPHLTVRGNICFSMSLAGMKKADQNARADKVAKLLQLEQLMDRRQRVAIGRALVRDPEVFLFDEPLSNLDALLRVQMRLELAKLHQNLKTTMIYVTHDQVEAMTLADKIVVLDKGIISQAGTPLELYNAPANRFVASFIGSPAMNFLPATLVSAEGRSLRLGLLGKSEITLQAKNSAAAGASKPNEIGIRPEHVRLLDPGDKAAALKGVTTIIEQLGNTTFVYVDSEAGPMIVEADGALAMTPGTNVGIGIDANRAHVFGEGGEVV